MAQPTAKAFIDDREVPASMTLPQLQALFPNGVVGLYDMETSTAVLPTSKGGVELTEGHRYALPAPIMIPTPTTPLHRATPSAFFEEESATFSNNAILQMTPPASRPHLPPAALDRSHAAAAAGQAKPAPKLLMDRVYDSVALPPLVVDIIDTPEFQRLRGLKQLGATSFLYPGATHTRFEHSIGVAHLSSLLAKKLHRRQPELLISERDILCVTIAGLCHDLGHGPFSHLFEDIIHRVHEAKGNATHWAHEDMSVKLVRRILDRIDMELAGLQKEDTEFIVLCITGLKPQHAFPEALVGRTKEKRFLLDIVSNKRNGIDVDKLDYFMRDSTCCYGRASIDCHIPRLINSCRAVEVDGQYQLCFEEKMAQSLGDIFSLRARMHKYAYQHRVPKLIDHMISDALVASLDHFHVRGTDGRLCNIVEAVDDVEGYCNLGDWIMEAISASPDPNLAPAQKILRRVQTRDLYVLAGLAMFTKASEKTTKNRIRREIIVNTPEEHRDAVEENLIIDFIEISYGSKDKNGLPDDPIDHVCFFNPKSDPDRAAKLPEERQSPLFAPRDYAEKTVLFISRDRDTASKLQPAIDEWKRSHGRVLSTPVPSVNSPQTNRKRMRSTNPRDLPTFPQGTKGPSQDPLSPLGN